MKKRPKCKTVFCILLALFFIAAGSGHFIKPEFYLPIMPSFLPHPIGLIYVSGVFEILGGLGLLIPTLRRLAGIGLILLLIAVFPANIQMLLQSFHREGFSLFTILLIVRLPLQFAFIALVNWVSKDG